MFIKYSNRATDIKRTLASFWFAVIWIHIVTIQRQNISCYSFKVKLKLKFYILARNKLKSSMLTRNTLREWPFFFRGSVHFDETPHIYVPPSNENGSDDSRFVLCYKNWLCLYINTNSQCQIDSLPRSKRRLSKTSKSVKGVMFILWTKINE